MDVCITCGQELAIMERNRAECWECRDKASESYSESENEELVSYGLGMHKNSISQQA